MYNFIMETFDAHVHLYQKSKNKERHTAHTIVSLPILEITSFEFYGLPQHIMDMIVIVIEHLYFVISDKVHKNETACDRQ